MTFRIYKNTLKPHEWWPNKFRKKQEKKQAGILGWLPALVPSEQEGQMWFLMLYSCIFFSFVCRLNCSSFVDSGRALLTLYSKYCIGSWTSEWTWDHMAGVVRSGDCVVREVMGTELALWCVASCGPRVHIHVSKVHCCGCYFVRKLSVGKKRLASQCLWEAKKKKSTCKLRE